MSERFSETCCYLLSELASQAFCLSYIQSVSHESMNRLPSKFVSMPISLSDSLSVIYTLSAIQTDSWSKRLSAKVMSEMFVFRCFLIFLGSRRYGFAPQSGQRISDYHRDSRDCRSINSCFCRPVDKLHVNE